MGAPSQKQITQMLLDRGNGDQAAREKLTPWFTMNSIGWAHIYLEKERPGLALLEPGASMASQGIEQSLRLWSSSFILMHATV